MFCPLELGDFSWIEAIGGRCNKVYFFIGMHKLQKIPKQIKAANDMNLACCIKEENINIANYNILFTQKHSYVGMLLRNYQKYLQITF